MTDELKQEMAELAKNAQQCLYDERVFTRAQMTQAVARIAYVVSELQDPLPPGMWKNPDGPGYILDGKVFPTVTFDYAHTDEVADGLERRSGDL